MSKEREELELAEGEENLVLEEEPAEESPRKKERAEKKQKKEGKPRGRFGRKIREVFSELKKVTWPTFKTVVKQTSVVLVVVAAFLVVIFGVDSLLSLGLGALNPPTVP
jgi:preprotein translocase subunit SecE